MAVTFNFDLNVSFDKTAEAVPVFNTTRRSRG